MLNFRQYYVIFQCLLAVMSVTEPYQGSRSPVFKSSRFNSNKKLKTQSANVSDIQSPVPVAVPVTDSDSETL